MRRLCLSVFCLLFAAEVARATTPVAQADTVVFHLDMRGPMRDGWFDPVTEAVGLRGAIDPLSWGETTSASDPDGDSTYVVEVVFAQTAESLRVEYKIKVDGTSNPNSGWETGPNSVLILTGKRQVVDRPFSRPFESTLTGDIRRHNGFESAHVIPRDIWVYLPRGYDDSDKRYPVLYMHDGGNVFDSYAMGMEWEADEHAEKLIAAGEIEPVIVVGIGNTEQRAYEYTPTPNRPYDALVRVGPGDESGPLAGRYRFDGDRVLSVTQVEDTLLFSRLDEDDQPFVVVPLSDSTWYLDAMDRTVSFDRSEDGNIQRLIIAGEPFGGGADHYGRFITEELMPFIDGTYRTKTGPESTALGGSSFGGLATMYLGTKHADVFGGLLVVSPSVWWDNGFIVEYVKSAGEKKNQRIWLDMGTEEGEGAIEGARRLRRALLARGWLQGSDLMYVEDEGAEHNEIAWAGRMGEMLRFLFGATSDAR